MPHLAADSGGYGNPISGGDRAQFARESGPAEPAALAAVVELSVDDKRNGLGSAVHDDGEITGHCIDGIGYTVSSEVSSVCDDLKDNLSFADLTRFPMIVEDAPLTVYLCNEYPTATAASQ